jgi:hypothetical protein
LSDPVSRIPYPGIPLLQVNKSSLNLSSQHRMPVKGFGSVEYKPVGGEIPGSENFTQSFCNIDHFGVKIPDPLHFIF